MKNGEKLGLKVGLLTGLVLIGYFLLMKAFGLAVHTELRLFNFFILFAGVFWTIKRHSAITRDHYNYFDTLGKGCMTAITAVGLFALFFLLYLNLDTQFMLDLKQYSTFGKYLTPATATAVVALEGFASGMIIAYMSLSYVRRVRPATGDDAQATAKSRDHIWLD